MQFLVCECERVAHRPEIVGERVRTSLPAAAPATSTAQCCEDGARIPGVRVAGAQPSAVRIHLARAKDVAGRGRDTVPQLYAVALYDPVRPSQVAILRKMHSSTGIKISTCVVC